MLKIITLKKPYLQILKKPSTISLLIPFFNYIKKVYLQISNIYMTLFILKIIALKKVHSQILKKPNAISLLISFFKYQKSILTNLKKI